MAPEHTGTSERPPNPPQRSIFSNSPRPIVTFAPWEPPPDPAEDEC